MQSNLQGYLNAQDAVDQIRLSLNSPIGSNLVYVLVEGMYDCCLYPKFFNESIISLEYVGGGKGQVEVALVQLFSITKQILGICDADFRHLTKKYPDLQNLFFTDYHDIEMTMLKDNKTLVNVFTEYRLQNNALDILQDAMNGAAFSGYTRLYNDINRIELNFKSFSIINFYDVSNKTFNSIAFLRELNRRSPNKNVSIHDTDINTFITSDAPPDIFNLCNGHEVIELIVSIIKTTTANRSLSINSFCSVLRASFIMDAFKNTNLYTSILTWQKANNYDILL